MRTRIAKENKSTYSEKHVWIDPLIGGMLPAAGLREVSDEMCKPTWSTTANGANVICTFTCKQRPHNPVLAQAHKLVRSEGSDSSHGFQD